MLPSPFALRFVSKVSHLSAIISPMKSLVNALFSVQLIVLFAGYVQALFRHYGLKNLGKIV